jgi:hypothetical protein
MLAIPARPWFFPPHFHCIESTKVLLLCLPMARSGTMGTTSPGPSQEEQGAYQESTTRPKGTDQEAHNRGGLEDNYRMKSCK